MPRVLLGISIFWFGLSFLTDGLTTLVLPHDLVQHVDEGARATVLGALTFVALIGAMLLQPFAGAMSDRLRARYGRRSIIGAGLIATLATLGAYSLAPGLIGLAVAFIAVLICSSIAQAGQQGFIPDIVAPPRRGLASGIKGLMDVGGATASFVVLGALLDRGESGRAVMSIAVALVATFLITAVLVREPSAAALSSQPAPQRPGLWVFRLGFEQELLFKRIVVSRFLFLLGVYMVGRFWLFFVSDRLGLDPDQASEQAGILLAALTLITFASGPPAGWLADRLGRKPLMLGGSVATGLGTLLLIGAHSQVQILVYGSLMALGTAAFTAANWAITADLVPAPHAARLFAVANFGTAGAAAVAGLFGPVIDVGNAAAPGQGYAALLLAATAASLAAGGLLLTAPPVAKPLKS